MYWLALFAAVLANTIANIAFKKAMTSMSLEPGIFSVAKLAIDPWMWLGAASACVLLGSYLYALRGIQLSVAYPAVTGLAMLAITLLGVILLNESVSVQKLIAMTLIIVGVVLLKLGA